MGAVIVVFLLGLAIVSMFSKSGREGCLTVATIIFSLAGIMLVGILALKIPLWLSEDEASDKDIQHSKGHIIEYSFNEIERYESEKKEQRHPTVRGGRIFTTYGVDIDDEMAVEEEESVISTTYGVDIDDEIYDSLEGVPIMYKDVR